MTKASQDRARLARVRLLAIDPELESVVRSGEAAFATRYGVRVADFAFLVRDVVDPNVAQLERVPRSAPFGAYLAVDPATSDVVGTCAFVGAPVERALEIAYFTFPPHERRGVATAMARGLVDVARGSGLVDAVHAHTLPETNASTRVLTKLGFENLGPFAHPEDGTLWRWRTDVGASART